MIKDDMWESIWALLVPRKVRNFLWRVCLNSLPIRSNLIKNSVTNDSLHSICSQEEESVIHFLWNYKASNDVWANSDSTFHKWPIHMTDFNQLWEKFNSLNQNDIALVVVIMRNLWMRRNEFVFNNIFKAPLIVVQTTKVELNEYVLACNSNQQNIIPTTVEARSRRAEVKWIPLE